LSIPSIKSYPIRVALSVLITDQRFDRDLFDPWPESRANRGGHFNFHPEADRTGVDADCEAGLGKIGGLRVSSRRGLFFWGLPLPVCFSNSLLSLSNTSVEKI
jgi:hypothetical protein